MGQVSSALCIGVALLIWAALLIGLGSFFILVDLVKFSLRSTALAARFLWLKLSSLLH